jgi:hypothetical protein
MIAIAIAVAAGYTVMALMRPDLIVASPAEFHEHYKVWGQESFRIPEMLTMIFTYIFFNVQNSALFFLPLAVGAALSLPRMARRWQLVTLLAIAVLMLARMGSMIRQGMPLPYYSKARCCEVSYGNIFWNLGLGPPTIPDLWSFAHESTWRLSHGSRAVLSYFSVVLAAVALGTVIFAWKTRARDSLLWRLAGASVILGTVTLPVSQQYIDRYAIDTAWAAVILFALTIRWELPFVRGAAIAALVITAAFSMLATQEYFAMNRARWAAWWELRNRGVPIKSIDGGAEPYLYYELSLARTPRERRRMAFGGGKRVYVLAIEPLPGFRVIAHHPFTGWLGLHRAEIVTLERAPNQNGGQAPSPVNVPRSSLHLSELPVEPVARHAVDARQQRRQDFALLQHELRDTALRQRDHRLQLFLAERRPFAGTLNLDEAALLRGDDVHVDGGLRVFLVTEIERRLPADHADRDRGDEIVDRPAREVAVDIHPAECRDERDERAGDRRRARAAIGLNHVAIDPDRPLAEELGVDGGAQRAADQALNLHRPPALLSLRCFALDAIGRRARQHSVLGGDPSLSGAIEKRRDFFLDGCGANDARVADFDQHASLGVLDEVRRDAHRPQLSCGASVGAGFGGCCDHVAHC